MAAQQNAFHPVTDYPDRLEWDGTPRMESLFIDYLGCDDTDTPGHKFDFAPILEGSQGKGKSTFICQARSISSRQGKTQPNQLGGAASS